MSHNDQLMAFTAASPTATNVDYIVAANQSIVDALPARMTSASRDTPAMSAAKSAVAEYLRDLGLCDPDVIAGESQQIVAQAMREAQGSSLNEAAIRLCVGRLEHFLTVLAGQSGTPGETQRLTSGVAARLPALLSEFPHAFASQHMPTAAAATLRSEVAPVVPASRPQRMLRQRLALVPRSLGRFIDFVRGAATRD